MALANGISGGSEVIDGNRGGGGDLLHIYSEERAFTGGAT